jgi:2-polyprenyl-6-methoxyphenol hydroxylase-like FAD-dependent oxidoreductase
MGEGIRLPGDDAGFLAFAARLPNPQFHAALSLATPASPIFKRGRSPGQLRRFDRMSRFPERFVVLGDAACALNPIYGQGITVATLACTLLGRELERSPAHRPGFSHRFQRKLARQNADAWMLAIGSDLAWPTTHSNLPEWQQSAFRLAQPVMQRAGRAVTAAATADSLIASAVMERMHMCRSANSLMRGFVLRGVLGSFLHPPASLQPE